MNTKNKSKKVQQEFVQLELFFLDVSDGEKDNEGESESIHRGKVIGLAEFEDRKKYVVYRQILNAHRSR